MARNKYPEITEARILDVAQRLFLEKGYENTTIQDIVSELGGLTKGAVYHHFKSKEEIMDAVSDRMFFENNPFEAVKGRTDLNGLQKLREVVRLNQADTSRTNITAQSIPMSHNPRVLVGMIDANRRILTPYFLELIEEGNRDGSIHTEYAKEIAELLPLLTSLWLLAVAMLPTILLSPFGGILADRANRRSIMVGWTPSPGSPCWRCPLGTIFGSSADCWWSCLSWPLLSPQRYRLASPRCSPETI